MTEPAIEPAPCHCGCHAVLWQRPNVSWRVYCEECHAGTCGFLETREAALERWAQIVSGIVKAGRA